MRIVKTVSVGGQSRELAPEHVMDALFTTISCRLEPQGRGTRFPAVMDDLYSGYLQPGRAPKALQELQEIEAALQKVPIDRVVWSLQKMHCDDSREPVNHHAGSSFEYFVDQDGQPLIWRLRDAVQECLSRGRVLRLVHDKEAVQGTLYGLFCALLGVGWMLAGRAWFPNWNLQRAGMTNAKMPLWTFGMYLVMTGAGLMIAFACPGVRDWFRRHQPVFMAVVLILPIVWLVICARAGYLPD
jgi:2,3-bisphosphoglycerate-dependent phosphoglycerate mutase